MQPQPFNQPPSRIITATQQPIYCFETHTTNGNIDHKVVQSFGEEWKKFNDFDDAEIDQLGGMYFDILDKNMLQAHTYALDVGCGTGRWTKYLAPKVGFIEAIDPSDAILTAEKLLHNCPNVRLSRAATDNLPFADQTFDLGISVGVLHHIPDTQKALNDCVKKIKIGGYFYLYLYYNLENRGWLFKALLAGVTAVRQLISRCPNSVKKVLCDAIALGIYLPLAVLGRLLRAVGLPNIAAKVPLNMYQNQSFFVMRNDALDRFGTSLEQRFSRAEIVTMMQNSGLDQIVISPNLPYWHAVGKRVR